MQTFWSIFRLLVARNSVARELYLVPDSGSLVFPCKHLKDPFCFGDVRRGGFVSVECSQIRVYVSAPSPHASLCRVVKWIWPVGSKIRAHSHIYSPLLPPPYPRTPAATLCPGRFIFFPSYVTMSRPSFILVTNIWWVHRDITNAAIPGASVHKCQTL